MCVIIQLPPKKIISFEKFKNAVLNNPDGWGIIYKDRGELTIQKGCDPEKGNDPDEIYKVLQSSFGVERYIHIRNNTVGKTSSYNTHPFTVFNKDGRRVEFMHNGTIGKYRPALASDLSDTHNFALTFLEPLLSRYQGDNGLGDYTDPFFASLVKDTFDFSNRGLLVSNNLDTKEFGKWEEYKDGDESYRVSNDDYFDRVIPARTKGYQEPTIITGPRSGDTGVRNFQPANPATKPEAAKEAESVTTTPNVTPLKDINLAKRVSEDIKADDLNDLMSLSIVDFDEIENEQLTFFSYIPRSEMIAWVKKFPGSAGAFLELILQRFTELHEDFEQCDIKRIESNEKHERATKRVSELVFELNELQKGKE